MREARGQAQVADYAERIGSEDKAPDLHEQKSSGFELHRWRIPGLEHDDEEYVQDMSHEDLQRLALKLKGYGDAADPLAPIGRSHH